MWKSGTTSKNKFAATLATYLDAWNTAGSCNAGSFLDDDDDRGWQRVIDVNLRAALHGVRLAARAMSAAGPRGGKTASPRGSGGTIMLVASAGGVFPIPPSPVYAASKSALVHFVRSIEAQMKERGIRIVALCPQVHPNPALYRPTQANHNIHQAVPSSSL